MHIKNLIKTIRFFLSFFLNKEIQTQRNRTTRSPDPTAIEFQDIFREIMGAVRGDKKRFLFVIDNLDRLPESDAVAMWGTIRSFFLGTHGAARILKPEDMPIVILPIDEQAICRMYSASHEKEDAQTLARSFMDKTFDLTFHVPRPVLSDWNKYLAAQMAKVFGPGMDKSWPYITGRFYERYLISQSDLNVTPRTINTLINAIAVLWLQWSNRNVTFAVVSYYSIYRDAINANILQAVQIPQAPIADLDHDWQRGIAAIYYGASPDEAGQILIEQPLRRAISDHDPEAFSALRNIPSFDRVLLRILDGFASGNIIPDVIFRAAIILQNLGESNEPWFDDAWHRLHAAFRLTAQWQRFDREEGEGVVALVKHCHKNEFISFLGSLDEKLASLANNALISSQFSKAFATAWGAVLNVAKSAEWPLSLVQVPGDASVFLDVAVSSYENQELTKKFISNVTSDELTHQVAMCLADQARATTAEEKFLALHRLDRTFDWTELVTSAIAICRDQNAIYLGMPSALFILGKLGASDNAIKAQIKSLITGGQLATRLNEAYQHKISSVVARTLALLLIGENYNFPIPNNGAWNSFFDEDTNFLRLLNDAFLEFLGKNDSMFLFEAARINQALTTIVGPIITLRVQSKDLGPLNVSQIINDLPQCLRCIDDALHNSFIFELSQYQSFWDVLAKYPFEGNALILFRALMNEAGEIGQKSKVLLIDKLNGIDPAKWSNAIRAQTEPLLIANDLAAMPDASFEIGQNLYDGLQALISEILVNTDGNFRRRWFSATQFLSLNSRQTVLSNMRDSILGSSSVVQLPSLLLTGGTALIESGGFSDKADDCVRHIVPSLMNDANGVAWITEHSDVVEQWIEAAKPATKGFLRERLINLVYVEKIEFAQSLHRLLQQWFPGDASGDVT